MPEQPQPLPVGQLLAWADAHTDQDIRDQAGRARAALAGLRTRYDRDRELATIHAQTEELTKRLSALQQRAAELMPARPRRSSPSYDASAVRTWAATQGITCPQKGRVPRAVVDQWRAANAPEHGR